MQSEAGWRLALELIKGEAVVIPPTGGHASSIQGELYFALRLWQDRLADGGLLLQDVFVALGKGTSWHRTSPGGGRSAAGHCGMGRSM